ARRAAEQVQLHRQSEGRARAWLDDTAIDSLVCRSSDGVSPVEVAPLALPARPTGPGGLRSAGADRALPPDAEPQPSIYNTAACGFDPTRGLGIFTSPPTAAPHGTPRLAQGNCTAPIAWSLLAAEPCLTAAHVELCDAISGGSRRNTARHPPSDRLGLRRAADRRPLAARDQARRAPVAGHHRWQ